MENVDLFKVYKQSLKIQKLQSSIEKFQTKSYLKGSIGSDLSLTISEVFKDQKKPFLIIFDNKETAAFHFNDLEVLLPGESILFYPTSYRRPYKIDEIDNANVLLRSEVLSKINSQMESFIVVTYNDAIFEKVLSKSEIQKNTLKIKIGDNLSVDFVNDILFEYEFSKVDFVTEPGEFSIRGGIVDIFSFSNDKPYRVEFFGDEIESIRTFDIETQLSIGSPIKIQIVPNIEQKLKNEKRVNFLDYINKETQLWIQNINSLINSTNLLNKKAAITFKNLSGPLNYSKPKDLFCTSEDFIKYIEKLSLIEFGSDIFFNSGSNGQEVNVVLNLHLINSLIC